MKKILITLAALIVLFAVLFFINKNNDTSDAVPVTTEENSTTLKTANKTETLPSVFKESGDDTNGTHIGFIKKIGQSNGNYSINIDYVQWTACKDCDNDYSVSNTNEKVRTFKVLPTAAVRLQTHSHKTPDGELNFDEHVLLPDFITIFNKPTQEYAVTRLLYWITIKDGAVTAIVEQYQP